MTKKLAELLARQQVAAMQEKIPANVEVSPHGFLSRCESKPDYRGEVYYTIRYGKKAELFMTCDRQAAKSLWWKLCKLELLIVKTIGGEILNQW